MKKVSLVILFLLSYCISFSQFTVTQNLGAPKTLVVSKGGLSADSALILPYFPDTATANLSPYVKYYAGNMIRVGNIVYVRNSTASGWITIGSGSGGGTSSAASYFGSFYDSTTQAITSTTTAYPIKITKTDTAKGFHLTNNRIIADSAGIYNFQWSGQFQNTDNAEQDVTVWIRKNGVNVVGSSGYVSIPKTRASVYGHAITSWNYIINMSAGDSIVWYWQATSTLVSLQYYPQQTNPARPSTASVIVTVTPVLGGGSGGSGSVTSISQGYGITNTPNPITSTGTIRVDTATLSTKYMLKTDTTNKFVNNITRTPGKDSIIFFIGANRYAIKDSAGGSGTTTTAVDTIYRTIGKDSIQFKINGRYHAIKDSSGGSGTVTTAVDTIYRTIGKDSIQFSIGGRYRAIKDSVGVSKIVAGTGISVSPISGLGQVIITSTTSGGTVTSVTAASPLSVTNSTTTPYIGIDQAGPSSDGYLSYTYFNSFNSRLFSIGASGLITASGGSSPIVSTSMSANKLVGRNPSTSGEMQEITLGSGLYLTGTTLSATGGGGGGGSQNLQQVLDTGYTLNGNFYFQTNSFDSVINLSGSRLSAPRTYQFPDSSGIIALKSDLSNPHYQIDLSSSNYTMTNYGVYEIKIASDSANPWYIIFPDANDFTGQRITLINADNSGFPNNALIDTSANEVAKPKYQGTYKTIWQIPFGMTYEFVSVNGRWMSTNPMPVNTNSFISDYDGSGITTYDIPFGGIYKLTSTHGSKGDGYYITTFPDPKKNNGERITLMNIDTTYNLRIEGTWIPISKVTYGGAITRIAPQSTYEFVSIDSQWVCVNMSTPPTYFNIDLTSSDFNIPSCGVYQLLHASSSSFNLIFPDPINFDGKTLTIINSDDTYDANLGGFTPNTADGTGVTVVPSTRVDIFTSIGGKWFLTSYL